MSLCGAVTALVYLAAFAIALHLLHVSHVADALVATTRLYVQEESRRFGPGGNATDVLEYPMPHAVAKRVERDGPGFLHAMPPGRARRSRDWRARCPR